MPTTTMLALLNPEPETVRVKAAEPAFSFEGLIEVIAGAGVVGVLPLPAEEPPLEHPVKEPRRIRLREATERKNEADEQRNDTEKGTDNQLSDKYFSRTKKDENQDIAE